MLRSLAWLSLRSPRPLWWHSRLSVSTRRSRVQAAPLVCLPSRGLVLLDGGDRIGSSVDASPGDEKIRAAGDGARGRLILLAESITFTRDIDAGGEDDKIFIVGRGGFVRGVARKLLSRDEPHNGPWVLPGNLDRRACVVAHGQGALGGHLGEDEDGAIVGNAAVVDGLVERLDDALAGKDAGVDDVRPFGDAQHAALVLLLHGVANVDEFAVFEDQEVVLLREIDEALDCRSVKVGEDVDVRFQDRDVRS